MKAVVVLGILVAVWSPVSAETTCNTAQAKKGKAYVGPNGVEDASGGEQSR
jgi:hypothetical protein